MHVIEQGKPQPSEIPGIRHVTWAGHGDGLSQLSVWRQTLAPAAATPPHRHDCDEVLLCHAGRGEVHSEDQVQSFGPDSTVILPAGKFHQLFNVGTAPLEITGILAQTPVKAYLPDDEVLELPWRS